MVALGPGPRNIALNRCCCPIEDGCLKGVCYVTVEFRNVKNPTVSIDPDTDSPPALHTDFNKPSDPDGGAYGGDPNDVACNECIDWNREWQLFLYDGPGFGDGDADFVDFHFAIGQAGGGFASVEDVYDIPGAGDVCFPCADVGDNTGLRLDIVCVGNRVAANLTLVVKGCTIVNWTWELYLPDFYNLAGTTGVPRPSDAVTDDFHDNYKPFFSDQCYVPSGVCKDDPCFGQNADVGCQTFPCFVAEGIATFYDKQNCYWSNLDDDKPFLRFYLCEASQFESGGFQGSSNPTACDPCTLENIHYPSSEFSSLAGGGTETEIDPYDKPGETATGNHVWRLTSVEVQAGIIGLVDDKLCTLAPPIPPDDTVCSYDIFLRWGFNTSNSDPGTVRIYSIDEGSGPAFDFETGKLDDPELPLKAGSLEQFTTHVIDGVRYRRIGQIRAACDASLKIEVIGPRFPNGASMDFDELLLQRV